MCGEFLPGVPYPAFGHPAFGHCRSARPCALLASCLGSRGRPLPGEGIGDQPDRWRRLCRAAEPFVASVGRRELSAKRVTAKAAKAAASATLQRLAETYPDAHCELVHKNAFELLCATVLSAQTTDVAVNKITPALFAAYPTAEAMAKAEPAALEPLLSTIGMFRQKSKNLVGLDNLEAARHVTVASFFFPEDQHRMMHEFFPSVLEHGRG